MTFRPSPYLTLFTIISLAILLALGTWQMNRLSWKEALIEQVNARTQMPPQDLDQLLSGVAETTELEYAVVTVTGAFDHSREAHLYRLKTGGSPGYNIITVLQREGLPDVLVNRGYVPLTKKDPATRLEGQITGSVSVSGLVRLPQSATSFLPPNNPGANEWYFYDFESIRDFLTAPDVLPVFVEADATANPGGLPEGGLTRIEFKNDHLGYAITWYGLAAALFAVYIAYHVKTRRFSFR